MSELPVRELVDGWDRERVQVRGRWAGLVDRNRCLAALKSSARTDTPAVVRARLLGGSVGVPLGALDDALDAGGTLIVEGFDRWDPDLASLARRAARELGHAGPIRVDLALAPPGGPIGAVDAPSLVFQAEGRTRWDDGRELAPGDLLHLPTGQGEGLADGAATLVRLVLVPVDFSEVLERLVWRELARFADWREVPPLRGDLSGLDQRLDELATLLRVWKAHPHELLRTLAAERWREPEQEPGAGPGDGVVDLAPSVVVLRNAPGSCLVVANDAEIEVAGPAAAVLRHALVSAPFRRDDLDVAGLFSPSVGAMVTALVEAGVLRDQSSK